MVNSLVAKFFCAIFRLMMRPALTIRHKLLHATTIITMLWIGGLHCLAACATMLTVSAEPAGCDITAEGRTCCHTQPNDDGDAGRPAWQDSKPVGASLDCCSFERQPAERPEQGNAKMAKFVAPHATALASYVASPPRYQRYHVRPYLPDQRQTYLRCCVFLI